MKQLFQPGQSGNPSGRPKGAPNKASAALRERITAIVEASVSQLVEDLQRMEPKDRIRALLDLMQYTLPKLQSISTTPDFEHLTEEQLDYIIDGLRNPPTP